MILSFLKSSTILSFSKLSFRFIKLFEQSNAYNFLKRKAQEETGINTINYTFDELVRLSKLISNNDQKIQRGSAHDGYRLIVKKNRKIYSGIANISEKYNLLLIPNLDNVVNFCTNGQLVLLLDYKSDIYVINGWNEICDVLLLHKELVSRNPWDPTRPIFFTKISSDMYNCSLLANTGDVFKFKINSYGKLAVDDFDNKTGIYLIPELNNIIDIACGDNHSLALDANGLVYSYGYNGCGELGFHPQSPPHFQGQGVTEVLHQYRLGEYYYSPRLIPNLLNVTQIAVGDSHSVILSKDGSVYSFGNNGHGQLGLKGIIMTHIPTLIPELKDIIQIVTGAYHTLALREDGKVYVFGYNKDRELGIPDTRIICVPILLEEANNIKRLWAKGMQSLFITKDDDILSIINGKLVSIGSAHI
jgi:alpha-tubulin suppressor-like RCC1 family protein